ncbi:MAG: MFS transporter [Isosphaeraceae bacterium]
MPREGRSGSPGRPSPFPGTARAGAAEQGERTDDPRCSRIAAGPRIAARPGPGSRRGASRGRERGELVLLLILASVQFTSIVDFMVVMPLGPQLRRTMDLNASQFGWIVSSYTVSAGVAGLVASTFLDRFGRKRAFLSLFVGFLAGTLCCGLAGSYSGLLLARVVTGAFGGILGGMALAIVGDVFPEERRGRATGVLMSSFALASVVGVPACLAVGTRFGWHVPFLALAALGLPIPRWRPCTCHPCGITFGGASRSIPGRR